MTRTEYSVFALTPNKNGVYHYHDEAWIEAGGPAARLYGGDWGLLAVSPSNGDIFRYLNEPGRWEHIGGPGASFAVTGESVYGLTPDRGAVWRYDGQGTSWDKVGGPAAQIYGGTWGLVATNPENGDVFRYLNEPGRWEHIGGPGASFAVTGESVYGLTPDRGAVWRYDGQGTSWDKVGGPAAQIYGGTWGLVATNPENGTLWAYNYHSPDDNPDPPTWRQIGGPGADFSVSYESVFGLTPDRGAVYRYDGTETWTKIGGPADSIAAALWWTATAPAPDFDLVNDARQHPEKYPPHGNSAGAATAGCAGGFIPSAQLTDIARSHNAYLKDQPKDWVNADQNMHRGPDGKLVWDPGEPMEQAGYRAWRAENVAVGFPTADAAVRFWMQDDEAFGWGHRNAILRCETLEAGLGHLEGGPWGHYWTLDMGTK